MKERRKAGATHSFRLTREAADIVDNMNHPRRLGGKSRKVSDAIVAFFGHSYGGHQMPSYGELVEDVEHLQKLIAKKGESEAQVPAWWRRFWPF
jgi:hypothetical protein